MTRNNKILSALVSAWFLMVTTIGLLPSPAAADKDCYWKFTAIQGNKNVNPQCKEGEAAAPENRCGETEKPSSWLSSSAGYYHCCCQKTEPEYTPVSAIMPDLQIPIPDLRLSKLIDNKNELSIPWIAEYVIALYDYGLLVAVLLAGLALITGGLLWLTSGGEEGKIRKAKEAIIGGVIGLIIILSGHLLLTTINPELTRFKAIKLPKINRNGGSPGAPSLSARPSGAETACAIELEDGEFPDDEQSASSLVSGGEATTLPSGGANPIMGIESNTASCGLGFPGYKKNGWFFAGTMDNFGPWKPPKGSNIYCPAAITKKLAALEHYKEMRNDIRNSQIKSKRAESLQNIRARIFRVAQSFWLQEQSKKITSYNCSGGLNQGNYAKEGTRVHTCVDVYSGTITKPKSSTIQLFDCGGWVGYVYMCAGLAVPGGPTFNNVLWNPGFYKAKILGNIKNIDQVKGGDFFGVTANHAMIKIDKNSFFECGWNTDTKEHTGCVKKSPMSKFYNEYAGGELHTFPLEYIVDYTAQNFYKK